METLLNKGQMLPKLTLSRTCHKADIIYHLVLRILAKQTWFRLLLLYLTVPVMDFNLELGALKILCEASFVQCPQKDHIYILPEHVTALFSASALM